MIHGEKGRQGCHYTVWLHPSQSPDVALTSTHQVRPPTRPLRHHCKVYYYPLCQFLRATRINYYKLSDLKQHKCILSQFWRLSAGNQGCQQGHAPSKYPREESFFTSSCFCWLLANLALPGLVHKCIILVSSSTFTYPSPLSMSKLFSS